jgi:hypothetical protein
MPGIKLYVKGVRIGAEGGDAITQEDLKEAFEKFGTTGKIWVARSPSGFGFVEFAEQRDGEDPRAVREVREAPRGALNVLAGAPRDERAHRRERCGLASTHGARYDTCPLADGSEECDAPAAQRGRRNRKD